MIWCSRVLLNTFGPRTTVVPYYVWTRTWVVPWLRDSSSSGTITEGPVAFMCVSRGTSDLTTPFRDPRSSVELRKNGVRFSRRPLHHRPWLPLTRPRKQTFKEPEPKALPAGQVERKSEKITRRSSGGDSVKAKASKVNERQLGPHFYPLTVM